jgi:nicotinamide mononucleotide (NMN) deamidase PncC
LTIIISHSESNDNAWFGRLTTGGSAEKFGALIDIAAQLGVKLEGAVNNCVRNKRSNSMGTEPLEKVVGQLLTEQKLTIALAESCTGGLIAHRLTDVPGSSAYLIGGVVSYANEAKERMLGVSHQTLQEHGAVSEEAAREMSRGVRRLLQTDVALAVTGIAGPSGGTPDTGIAGPSGGTPEKPVGLTYIVLTAEDLERCERYLWKGDRWANKEQSAAAALRMLCEYLEARQDPPSHSLSSLRNAPLRNPTAS